MGGGFVDDRQKAGLDWLCRAKIIPEAVDIKLKLNFAAGLYRCGVYFFKHLARRFVDLQWVLSDRA